MNRREFLALIPAARALPAFAAQPPFDRIDTHIHIHRPVPMFTAGMEKSGWRALSICDSRAVGSEQSIITEMMDGTAKLVRESGGRFGWAATFDPRSFEARDFAESVIADLKQRFSQGAIAVKIWKNIGTSVRSKSGKYMLPDDPSLLPIFEAIQKEDRAVVAHLADPSGAWLPLDEKNPEINYYKNNPQWHMLSQPGAPMKEDILNARDRVMARYPKLRFVGCHLGSNEDDLPKLASRLDSYPNFAVDCAARVRYFMAGDRDSAIQFLTRYQDRVTYGTDYQIGNAEEQRAWENHSRRIEDEWRYFSTTDTITARNRSVQGLGLPEPVLRKIFFENPKRWFKGLV
jgi:predicted TIM-barrel fold metal-dependent hydrolase